MLTFVAQLRSYWGHVDVVKCLLDHGASVKIEKTSGATALHSATRQGCVDVAIVLLDRGAEVRLKWVGRRAWVKRN